MTAGVDELEASVHDFPFAFGTRWAGNQHRSTAGAAESTRAYVDNTDLVELFDYSRLVSRDQREGSHQRTGGDLGLSTEQFRFLSLIVDIRRPTYAALEDALA